MESENLMMARMEMDCKYNVDKLQVCTRLISVLTLKIVDQESFACPPLKYSTWVLFFFAS